MSVHRPITRTIRQTVHIPSCTQYPRRRLVSTCPIPQEYSTSSSSAISQLIPQSKSGYAPSRSEQAELAAAWMKLRSSSLFANSPIVKGAETEGSEPDVKPEPEYPEGEISDQEWEIRTGRAIYILQETLPDFFQIGLISSLDSPIVRGEEPKSNGHAPSLTRTILSGLTDKGKAKAKEEERESESIYSPRIRLEYTPPVSVPAPLPKTLRVEGLHLYIASSVFVRHTLNALYSDLHVVIRRVRIHGPRPLDLSSSSGKESGTRPPNSSTPKHRSTREKSFFVGLGVSGTGRVSGAKTEWEVNCTYTFSPISGLIHLHTVNSIEPAPHQSLFEALGRFGLIGGGPGVGGAGGAAR